MSQIQKNIQEYLKENGCDIEKIASSLHVSKMEVLTNLPKEIATVVNGDKFDEVIKDIETWGEVLFVKVVPSFVIEFKTNIPKGSYGHGYYNFSMSQSQLGGHLKADDIDKILFLSAKVMRGMLSHSVQFFDKNGDNIFKLYVARDKKRELVQSQVEAYEALRAKFA